MHLTYSRQISTDIKLAVGAAFKSQARKTAYQQLLLIKQTASHHAIGCFLLCQAGGTHAMIKLKVAAQPTSHMASLRISPLVPS